MIKEGVFDDPSVVALLERHDDFCAAETSQCKMHRLDISQLQAPDIRFWTNWYGATAVGCIALRDLGGGRGEVKSMHVLDEYRGTDMAEILLNHLVNEARTSGMNWLGLETGDTSDFDRAVAFYSRHGFEPCDEFGDYTKDNAGRLMAMEIGN